MEQHGTLITGSLSYLYQRTLLPLNFFTLLYEPNSSPLFNTITKKMYHLHIIRTKISSPIRLQDHGLRHVSVT